MFRLGFNLKKMNPLAGVAAKELVGVELSGNLIKFALVRTYGDRREVAGLVAKNISGMSESDISKTANAVFHSLKTKNAELAYTVPSNLVITKNIEIPSTDPREIREIINLQAGRHTPYAREEIIVDYIEIGTYKQSYTKILLVIVARSTIKRQFDILEKSGLRFDRVLLSPEGLGLSAQRVLKAETMASPICIVHIDELVTDFMVVFKNKIAYLRSIPIGASQIVTDRARSGDRFLDELRRSIEAYQSENIEAIPSAAIITGAVDDLGGMEASFIEALKMPARVSPYYKNIVLSPDAVKVTQSSKSVSFLGVIAPLFSWDSAKVDLVPEEVKLRKSIETRGKELIKTGIMILSIFVLICSIFITKIYFKSAYLKSLTEKYDSLGRDAGQLEEGFEKVSLVRSFMASRGFSLEVLSELFKTLPMEVELADIRYDEQGKMNLRGSAETMSAVFFFVNALEKTKYFKDVKTKYTSKRKDAGKDITDFEIMATIEKGR